jgi:hypothetical protein
METFSCRIQYLNDTDPFTCTSLYPEPSRPPSYSFNIHLPLINQIASVHRILGAPHSVSKILEVFVSIFHHGRSHDGSLNQLKTLVQSYFLTHQTSILYNLMLHEFLLEKL